jgi:hypothetical protein
MGKDHDRIELEPAYDLAYRLAFGRLLAGATGYRQRIFELKSQRHGGDWLLQNLRIFSKQYPTAVLDILRRHAALGKLPLVECAPTPPSNGGGAAGAVRGIRIFALDTEDWPLTRLARQLGEFAGLRVESAPIEEVRRWTEWANALEAEVTEFRYLLEEGRKFFTRTNLALLPYAVDDPALHEELLWMVVSREGEAKPEAPRKPGVLKRLLMGLNS